MLRPDLNQLERDRLEADRGYNDALTAVDRAVANPPTLSDVVVPAVTIPAAPHGWRRRWLRAVADWLAPALEQQRATNDRLALELATLTSNQREIWRSLEHFETTLVLFLQRITAFVDTKDRELVSAAGRRLDRHDEAFASISDLGAQVGVLQRAVQMLKRELQPMPSPAAASGAPSPRGTAADHLDDFKYLAFEDRFRGSDEQIREKQRSYVPLFADASDVLDIGCGRGEFLALLHAAGIRARGIDVNRDMVAVGQGLGLAVAEADALAYLQSQDDESIGGLMAAQVVEHLEPQYLMRLLDVAHLKLRPGAPIVIETINPACWLAFFSSYIRDVTHVRPLHPETLQYLLSASGFERVSLRYSAPVPDHMKMKLVEPSADVPGLPEPTQRALASATSIVNQNATILNDLLFTFQDYAAIGYRR